MGKRAERREKARKRREEIKGKLICIIGDHLPNTAGVPKEELDAAFSKGLAAADAWVDEESRKNPQERSLLRDGVNMAMKFLRENLHAKAG